MAVHQASLDQWALETAALELARRGLRPLSLLGAEAIAARAVRLAADNDELERLSAVADMPGFARSVRATIAELRAAAVPAPVLLDDERTSDLGRLLLRFVDEMKRFGLADQATVQRLARTAVAEERVVPPSRSIWLDLQVRSRRQADLLQALAGQSVEVLATVAAGDDESIAWLTSILDEEAPTDLDAGGNEDGGGPLDRVQRFIFRAGGDVTASSPAAAAEDAAAPASVDLFSAAGEGQECVEIARRIRRAAAGGMAFDRMAVLVRQPVTYLPLVEDALGRAGIPAFYSRGSLRPNPAGRAFLALLACAAERLSATRFAEYLSLGQTPDLTPGGAPRAREAPWVEPAGEQLVIKSPGTPAAEAPSRRAPAGGSLGVPAQWERLLVDAAVVGGVDRWRRRLEGLDAEYRLRLAETVDETDSRRGYLERQIERLATLRNFALPIVEVLDGLPDRADWGVWLDRLGELAALALRRPESVLEALVELRPLEGVDEVDLAEVERILAERLRFSRLEPLKGRYGRVFVGAVEEAAGRFFDLVFVPGLAEGVFPRRSGEDALLLDDRRSALRRLNCRLPVDVDRTRREQLLLRLAAGAAANSLVVSFPRVDLVQGRARVPSLYALDLLRAAEGRLPDLDTLARRAAAAGAAVVGWPAPADPEDAIDEAEFDLSLLLPLLGAHATAEERKGRAAFLLSSNEHLARALRARARRWRPGWFPVDGLVDPGVEARDCLSRHRIGKRAYSPTALQHFAACPYRFFLQAVLRLRPRDELVRLEQLDPMTRGAVFHEIQFRLFAALREADLLPVTMERLERAFGALDEVLVAAERDYRDRLAPPIERVWTAEFGALRADLRGSLRQVADEGGGFRPIHAELGFGLSSSSDRDPSSVRAPAEVLDGALLRGSIDLVEEDREGRLRVTDYKTGGGGARPRQIIGGGQVLQPVLYGLAAEAVLEREVTSGRLFFCTQRGGYREVPVRLNRESRGAARRMLDTVDGALGDGFLPAAPNKGACRYCDYRPVCGPYEELRVARKRRDRLEPLDSLRRER